MKNNSLSVGAGIFLLSWIAIVSYPLFIYSWFKLKTNDSADFFVARGKKLIIIQTIIMFISCNIITPIGVLYEDTQNIDLSNLMWSIIDTIDQALLLAVFMIMALRIWIVNYSHTLQLEMVRSTWKSQLSLFTIDSSSFYIKYKSTLGSYKWLTHFVALLYIMLCIIFVFLLIISPNDPTVSYALLALLYLITIILIIVIWCKYPAFNDYYCIRKELKEQVLFSIFIMIMGVGLLVLLNSIGIEGAGTFGQYTGVFLCDGLCFILVLRVIKLNTDENDEKRLAELVYEDSNTYSLKDIVNDDHGYEEFMNALVHEFCSETLLFSTEYIQFRTSLGLQQEQKLAMNCMEFDTVYSEENRIRPSSISSVSSESGGDKDVFLEMVKKLYNKYIKDTTAPFEINISYEQRIALAQLIDDDYKNETTSNLTENKNISVQELQKTFIPILESILFEVIKAMASSFMRFKKSDQWIGVCTALTQKRKASV